MWQPQKDGEQTPPVRCFRAWAARLTLVIGIHLSPISHPWRAPPCFQPSHSCCFARPTSPASLTCKRTWCASSACPCKDHSSWAESQNSQMGCLTQNFKDLSPLPPAPYFHTACSTQLAEHYFFLPSLTLVNKAMSHRARTATPNLFSVLLAPSLLSQQKEAFCDNRVRILVTSLLLPAHTDHPESSAKDSQ